MNIAIRYIPSDENEWTITRSIASVLHSEHFAPSEEERRINFKVKLHENAAGGVGHDGSGYFTIPNSRIGFKFLHYVREHPIKSEVAKKKLKFHISGESPPPYVVKTLEKTPFVSPDIEEKHVKTLWALEDKLRVDAVQFGVYFRPSYPGGRSFSIEWERSYAPERIGWLKFEYDHKLIRITLSAKDYEYILSVLKSTIRKLGDELREINGSSVSINFASIRKIGVGYDVTPYLCFDTLTPPVLEEVELHRTLTGDRAIDNEKYKYRIGSLDERHLAVAPYATQMRIQLFHDPTVDMIAKFIDLCRTAGIGNLIARFRPSLGIVAQKKRFFEPKKMYELQKELAKLPWSIAFQMESLLRSGLLHTELMSKLLPRIKDLRKRHPRNEAIYVGDLLRRYNERLQTRNTPDSNESPLAVFEEVLKKFDFTESKLSPGTFLCYHVTFTPTRLILEGPYATQSNRVIRQYASYEDRFVRVDFRDEDRLQYRWDREVDGSGFLRERVGGVLKKGFELAGRYFEFLAYSTSALREHAVWFMSPFHAATKHGGTMLINSEYIRNSLGDFKGTDLLKQPSKYAARLAQAFTATDPSVIIHRNHWEEVEDLGEDPYLFTDGVGTISQALANRIWDAIRKYGGIPPDAFQIRFMGYKGVVRVDKELDKHPKGIQMRLRPSMRKFENKSVNSASIEIAQAFDSPNICYLNRPLVMLLEHLGTRKEDFMKLQDNAIANAKTIDHGLKQFRDFMWNHGLGAPFNMTTLLERILDLGLDLGSNARSPSIDTPFLRLLRSVAVNDVLRDIKHSARIPIPESYLLVGVADEGPAYEQEGYDNVYKLQEGQIYACVQRPGDPEPTWIEGACSISRSPVVHPGDVQRVYAIGKPPEKMFCTFRDLKNLVVLPSVGARSLASCLGGGDVDGDLFAVITNDALLPLESYSPAQYLSAGTKRLERDSTVEDICDFVVEYINSDVLGLLSDRLLVIADQSKDGFSDEDCLMLAELCSQAVDYPKQGIPVDLDNHELPRTLIRCKPDWHAAEVVSPRETDYYVSHRALGFLYRAVTLDEISESDMKLVPHTFHPLSDPISTALFPFVRSFIGAAANPSGQFSGTDKIFQRYVSELDYICVTHTLSNTPGVKLLEAEIVAGTILAKCSQKRLRKDRIYRMRLHASTLVNEIQYELRGKQPNVDQMETCIVALTRAWRAWEFSQKYNDRHGVNSFGFIALRIIFDCLDRLGVPLSKEKENN